MASADCAGHGTWRGWLLALLLTSACAVNSAGIGGSQTGSAGAGSGAAGTPASAGTGGAAGAGGGGATGQAGGTATAGTGGVAGTAGDPVPMAGAGGESAPTGTAGAGGAMEGAGATGGEGPLGGAGGGAGTSTPGSGGNGAGGGPAGAGGGAGQSGAAGIGVGGAGGIAGGAGAGESGGRGGGAGDAAGGQAGGGGAGGSGSGGRGGTFGGCGICPACTRCMNGTCAPEPTSLWKVACVRATIAQTRPNGDPWDTALGPGTTTAPDPQCAFWLGNSAAAETSVLSNTFTPNWNESITPNSRFSASLLSSQSNPWSIRVTDDDPPAGAETICSVSQPLDAAAFASGSATFSAGSCTTLEISLDCVTP